VINDRVLLIAMIKHILSHIFDSHAFIFIYINESKQKSIKQPQQSINWISRPGDPQMPDHLLRSPGNSPMERSKLPIKRHAKWSVKLPACCWSWMRSKDPDIETKSDLQDQRLVLDEEFEGNWRNVCDRLSGDLWYRPNVTV